MKKFGFILLAMAGACTSLPDESRGACNAADLDNLIGREATTELGAEAMRRSGAIRLRWIQPGDVVTMDYREDRLTVWLTADNRVERANCG